MKRGILIVLLAFWSAHSGAALIKMSFDMAAYENGSGVRSTIPVTLIADSDLWTLESMTIEINGKTLTSEDSAPNLGRDYWRYGADGWGWQATAHWAFSFVDGADSYSFLSLFTEGAGSPGINPIDEFFSLAESRWDLYLESGENSTHWSVYPKFFDNPTREIIAVPEPATLSLLALGLAAIGIRRRLRYS